MPNLVDLIDQTGLKKTAFAVEAGISPSYLYHIINGRAVSRAYAQRVANVINAHLNTRYTINDLNLNLSK